MHFLIPGIVSQTSGLGLILYLPNAIAAFPLEPSQKEVSAPQDATTGSLVEKSDFEVKTANSALYFPSLETLERQVYLTPKASRELGRIERGDFEVHSAPNACSLWTIEQVSRIKSALSTTDLSGYESSAVEVYSTTTGYELLITSSVGRQLYQIGSAIDAGIGLTRSQFLPGSPGYVAGSREPAVELIGVEVGYPPQPLPTGFIGTTVDVGFVERVEQIASSTRSANDVVGVASALVEVSSSRPFTSLFTLEVATEVNGRALPASIFSTIEPTRPINVIGDTVFVPLLEVGTKEVESTIFTVEYLSIERSDRYLQETIFPAIENSTLEPSGGQLYEISKAEESFLSDYAAESAITKPVS